MPFNIPLLVLSQGDVEVTVQLEHNLPHFEYGDVLADAAARAEPKLIYKAMFSTPGYQET